MIANLFVSRKNTPWVTITERNFIAMLKNAYAIVTAPNRIQVFIRNGDSLMIDLNGLSDYEVQTVHSWLNTRRALRNYVRRDKWTRYHPNTARTHDGRIYPSVMHALRDGLVKPDFVEPNRLALNVFYGNLYYLAFDESDAVAALEQLRDWHISIVG